MASSWEKRPPCRYSVRPVSASSATAASRGIRQRPTFYRSLVLGARLLQQAIEQAARGRRIRQPGDRAARPGRQLGAQRDLEIGEAVVAQRLGEPQHGRRADVGAFGQPGRTGQPGARIVREQCPADPALGLAQRRQRRAGRTATVSSVTVSRLLSGSTVIDRSVIEIAVTLSGASGCQSRSPKPVDPTTSVSWSGRAHRKPK